MRISDIKYKASQVLDLDKTKILKVFIFVGILSAICSYVSNSIPGLFGSLLNLAVLIGTLTLSHGYITTSLKVVNNRYDEVDIQEDGLTGIYRFKELFGTYFIQNFFMMIVILVFVLLGFVMFKGMISSSTIEEIRNVIGLDAKAIMEVTFSNQAIREILDAVGAFFLYAIVIAAIIVVFSANFALTFFILEKYKIKGVSAMKESIRLMKGYKKTYCLLFLSYIGWMFLALLIENILFRFFPIPIFTSIIGVVIANVLYSAKLHVSLAVLYEEIDLAKEVNIADLEKEV